MFYCFTTDYMNYLWILNLFCPQRLLWQGLFFIPLLPTIDLSIRAKLYLFYHMLELPKTSNEDHEDKFTWNHFTNTLEKLHFRCRGVWYLKMCKKPLPLPFQSGHCCNPFLHLHSLTHVSAGNPAYTAGKPKILCSLLQANVFVRENG